MSRAKKILEPEQVTKARAERETKDAKVELKGRGKYKAFHVNGKKKAGVDTFLKRHVVDALDGAATIVPLCPGPPEAPVLSEPVTQDDERGKTTHHKKLKALAKGKFIHKQLVKLIRDAMPVFIEDRIDAEKKKASGARGKKKRATALHPQLRAVVRMLAKADYIPLDGDIGVHIGNFATQLDLACYKKGGPKNEVTIFELKTGYNKLADYLRQKFRVKLLPEPSKGAVFSASERDKHMFQLMASTVQAEDTFKGKWIIKDSFLLNSRPDRAELFRVPEQIRKLNKHLLLKLRTSR